MVYLLPIFISPVYGYVVDRDGKRVTFITLASFMIVVSYGTLFLLGK